MLVVAEEKGGTYSQRTHPSVTTTFFFIKQFDLLNKNVFPRQLLEAKVVYSVKPKKASVKENNTYNNSSRCNMSQCLYTETSTVCCRSARRIPSIIDAWFKASENIATFSSFNGFPPETKREPIFPSTTIKAILAAKPVGQRIQS